MFLFVFVEIHVRYVAMIVQSGTGIIVKRELVEIVALVHRWQHYSKIVCLIFHGICTYM